MALQLPNRRETIKKRLGVFSRRKVTQVTSSPFYSFLSYFIKIKNWWSEYGDEKQKYRLDSRSGVFVWTHPNPSAGGELKLIINLRILIYLWWNIWFNIFVWNLDLTSLSLVIFLNFTLFQLSVLFIITLRI